MSQLHWLVWHSTALAGPKLLTYQPRSSCSVTLQCAGTLASSFPLPDPTDLLGASHVHFEELRTDLLQLTRDLEGAECVVYAARL